MALVSTFFQKFIILGMYNFGLFHKINAFWPFAGDFCTIMRGQEKGVNPCFNVPYFSSPNLKYNGEALGVDWEFDNAKWIKVQIVP
jgi:hypothetical protein